MADFAEDLDERGRLTSSYTAYVSYNTSEFHRVRLSFTERLVNSPGVRRNGIVALQWMGILGHHVHGFRDR
jgi:hypothetical protein